MKKWTCFLLIFALLLGSSSSFATKAPEPKTYELDPRMEMILPAGETEEMMLLPGNMVFAKDGSILLQQIDYNREVPFMQLTRRSANGHSSTSAPVEWTYGNYPYSFVAEDPYGRIYTASEETMYVFESNLNLLDYQSDLPFSFESRNEIDAMGQTVLIAQYDSDDFRSIGEPSSYRADDIIMATFKNPSDTILSSRVYERTYLLFDAISDSQEGYVIDFDFADDEDTLYVLYAEYAGEIKNYKIATVNVSFYEFEERAHMAFTLQDSIQLKDLPEGREAIGYEFDGQTHQVLFSQTRRLDLRSQGPISEESKLVRFNLNGEITDSILIPGIFLTFDAKGNKTVVNCILPYSTQSGHYLIDWSPKSGNPRALIHERTMHGKTLAVFRDQGYGLLRTEDPESGIIDYLAPLKTEENDVRLRIPLCDLVAKVQDKAQNLEILYGEDRIEIPMKQLDVRELLNQMPCETDATIELHLTRNEDGSIQTTGELFVIEQVNAQTKRVHRLPIPLQ